MTINVRKPAEARAEAFIANASHAPGGYICPFARLLCRTIQSTASQEAAHFRQ